MGKTLNPFALELLGSEFGFFDTAPLVAMAKQGVDFGAAGLPGGLRPVGADRGTAVQWDRFRTSMLPDMLASGQARCVTDPADISRTIIHPIAIEDKAKPPPGKPQKSRMIHNLAGRLWDPVSRRRYPSFNDATPFGDLPSVPLTKVAEVVSVIVLLARAGYRDSLHGATIDLQAAYYQVALHVSQLLLLGFLFDGVVYVVTGLPFGSKASPSIFCRFVNLVWYVLRRLRIMIFWYIDDACVLGATKVHADRSLSITYTILDFCGFTVNKGKSMAESERVIAYLGVVIDLNEWVIRIQPKSIDKLRFVIGSLLERRAWPTYRLRPILDSLVGLLNFLEVVIHALRPFKHWVIGLRRAASKHEVFTLNDTHLDLLQSILQLGLTRNESPIWCREDELARLHAHETATDACEEGFGGWGRSPDGEIVYFYGEWRDLVGLPEALIISDKEFLTHAMAVDLLLPHVVPGARAVDLAIDNQNAMSWVNHLRCQMFEGNGATQQRFHFLRCYWLMCATKNLAVTATYIHTLANRWADCLSRPAKVQDFVADLELLQLRSRRIPVSAQWFQRWTQLG